MISPNGDPADTGGGSGGVSTQSNITYSTATGEAGYPGVTTAWKATCAASPSTIVWAASHTNPGANPFSYQLRIRGDGSTVGRTVAVQVRATGGVQANANLTSENIVLTAGYQTVDASATIDFSDRTEVFWRVADALAADGDVYYVTATQIETGLTINAFTSSARAETLLIGALNRGGNLG